MRLAELFPDADYAFHLRFKRGTFEEFFGPTPEHASLLRQRRQWLQTTPGRYAALLPEGAALLEETIKLGRRQGTFSDNDSTQSLDSTNLQVQCEALGAIWEPDYLLLASDSNGQLRLLGGCLCFPSNWSLTEKIGRPMEEIHGVVPGLNQSIGSQISGLLSKLRAGTTWLRFNWGLSRSTELNLHPERRLAGLDGAVQPEEVWLRVEHQALVALPETQGVLFGIRIALYSFAEIARDHEVRRGVRRALQTMPEAMAQYKGLATVRPKLIAFLV